MSALCVIATLSTVQGGEPGLTGIAAIAIRLRSVMVGTLRLRWRPRELGSHLSHKAKHVYQPSPELAAAPAVRC